MWKLVHGSLPPDGVDIDHICRVRFCVNPDHLRAVTRSENLLNSAMHFLCRKGHSKSGKNLKVVGGQHCCRTCYRAADRRQRLRARLREACHMALALIKNYES
jgi:hypothetical protein